MCAKTTDPTQGDVGHKSAVYGSNNEFYPSQADDGHRQGRLQDASSQVHPNSTDVGYTTAQGPSIEANHTNDDSTQIKDGRPI